MLISAIKAKNVLSKRCIDFLTYEVSKVKSSLSIDQTSTVQEFSDIFLKELSSLTLEWKVKFSIKVTLCITSISKAPYRIAPIMLQELKKQFHELFKHRLFDWVTLSRELLSYLSKIKKSPWGCVLTTDSWIRWT